MGTITSSKWHPNFVYELWFLFCLILYSGVGVLRNFLYVDVPAGGQNFDYTYFYPYLPPAGIPILNNQFCSKWVLFTIISLKCTQFVNFGRLRLRSKPRDRYSKRQTHKRIPCQCENPPAIFNNPYTDIDCRRQRSKCSNFLSKIFKKCSKIQLFITILRFSMKNAFKWAQTRLYLVQ